MLETKGKRTPNNKVQFTDQFEKNNSNMPEQIGLFIDSILNIISADVKELKNVLNLSK